MPKKYCQGTIEEVSYTTNVDQFVALVRLLLRHFDCVAVGHNAHKFDHYFLSEMLDLELPKDIETFKLMNIFVEGHSLIFQDTIGWLTGNLHYVGKIVGLKKLDKDIHDPAYCVRDTAIVVAAIKFVQTYLIEATCKFKEPWYAFYGVADMAYRYVHSFLVKEQHLGWSIELYNILKQSYYGGRVDSCMYGMFVEEDITCLDIRSMYPSSLCRELPAGNLIVTKSEPSSEYLFIAFCRCRKAPTTCASAAFGILPCRIASYNAFLDYGDVCGWYTSEDIRACRLDGWTIEVQVAYAFDSKTTLAPVYTNLYNMRKLEASGTPLNHAYKIAMNSSYGKFAQKERKTEGMCTRLHYMAWWCLAHTRMQLYLLKEMCKHTTILYGDTDSVFIPAKDVPVIKIRYPEYFQNELAQKGITLSDDGTQKGLMVIAKKVYMWGNTIKYKGMSKTDSAGNALISKDDMRDLWLGETVVNIRDGIACKRIRNGLCYIDRFSKLPRCSSIIVPPYKELCNKCMLYH